MTSEHSFAKKITVKAGSLRVIRYAQGSGPVRNEKASPAPTNIGWWAFPWPLVNWFYCSGKVDEVLPADLRQGKWFDKNRAVAPLSNDPVLQTERNQRRQEWLRDVGPAVIRLRSTWWKGSVYSHIDPRGQAHRYDWFVHDIESWVKAAHRFAAPDISHGGPDADMFELWLPAHQGGIMSGRYEIDRRT